MRKEIKKRIMGLIDQITDKAAEIDAIVNDIIFRLDEEPDDEEE